jgi:hypothetical protein
MNSTLSEKEINTICNDLSDGSNSFSVKKFTALLRQLERSYLEANSSKDHVSENF